MRREYGKGLGLAYGYRLNGGGLRVKGKGLRVKG